MPNPIRRFVDIKVTNPNIEKPFQCVFGKTNFQIKLGNIIDEEVDVIVNAAHLMLLGGGGVDGAIHKAAGPSLLQECIQFPIRNDKDEEYRCWYGECFLTKGYNLKAKNIIHTVAPKIVNRNVSEESCSQMQHCWNNALAAAFLNGFKSISFCSLGTGGHAFPLEQAATIAIDAIGYFLGHEDDQLREANIVCFDGVTKMAYEDAAKSLFEQFAKEKHLLKDRQLDISN